MSWRVVAGVALAILGAAAAAPALADPPAPAPAADPPAASVRLAHLSATGGALDLSVDGTVVASSVAFKTVLPYVSVAAGGHRFEARQPGASPSAAPLAALTADLAPGTFSTVGVIGTMGHLSFMSWPDGAAAPPPGAAEVRALHLSPLVPAVDIVVKGGRTLFSGVNFPEATPYQPLPAGRYDLLFLAAGTQRVLLEQAVDIAPGGDDTLAVLGGVGVPVEADLIQDAVGSPAVGAAGAGEGGGALPRQLTLAAVLLVPALLGLAVVAGGARTSGRA